MSTSKLKVYLAGPITGKTGEEVIRRYDEKKAILSDFGYEIYSPMTGKGYLRTEPGPLKSTGYTMPLATDQAIFHRDRWMVGMADVILADLSNSGDRVSIGTMFEIAWANILQKQIVLVLPEDAKIYDHLFIKQSVTVIFPDIEDAYDYLKELAASREWQDR